MRWVPARTYEWLQGYKPAARDGSMFVFDLPQPASAQAAVDGRANPGCPLLLPAPGRFCRTGALKLQYFPSWETSIPRCPFGA
jgi:hypothetical protein